MVHQCKPAEGRKTNNMTKVIATPAKEGAELPAVRKEPFHHHDVGLAKRVDELNQALNSPPKKEWVKQHPMNANLKYLPIERVEDTLRKIYGTYKVEVIHYGVIANAVTVHVRIHVIDPVTGDAIFQDGLGAVAIQVEKGAAATDFSKTRSDAIMKNLPAAKSYAIKDAAENFGKIFGSDLNRKDEIIFTSMYKNWEEQQNG